MNQKVLGHEKEMGGGGALTVQKHSRTVSVSILFSTFFPVDVNTGHIGAGFINKKVASNQPSINRGLKNRKTGLPFGSTAMRINKD
jgi:hypothetical protein